MKGIIKEIFLCENGVEKIKIPKSQEYKELTEKERKLFEKLKAELTEENFKDFIEFTETFEVRHVMLCEQYYTSGFKTAVNIIMESADFSDMF